MEILVIFLVGHHLLGHFIIAGKLVSLLALRHFIQVEHLEVGIRIRGPHLLDRSLV